MNKYWFSSCIVVGALLLAAPGQLAAREPKVSDPCRELRNDLDNQVNSLHQRQDEELGQCRQTHGKNSDVCRDLKNQQKIELRQMRDQRQAELDRCGPRMSRANIQGQTKAADNVDYRRNDCYPQEKYPEPPYKHPPKEPPKEPPVAHNPPKHGGAGHRSDGDTGD